MAGKVVGDLELKSEVFDVPFNSGLVHQIYIGLLANQRRGTHSTKTRGEVRGGGRKPHRQKGTGGARHGSRRSPIFRGGGITFGPKPRSYQQGLPKKMRHGALRCALSQRLRDENLTGLSEIVMDAYSDIKLNNGVKTKVIVKLFENLKLDSRKTLLVLGSPNPNVERSASNIPGLNVVRASDLNLVDIMKHDRVVATQEALTILQEALS
jgi:large subunit ribosomal protein L4